MESHPFQDLLNIETYKDDVTIEFGICQNDKEPESYTSVPESMVSRLVNIGNAYNLHIIQLIDVYDEIHLNATQCQNMFKEMEFIATIINDPALFQGLEPVVYLLSKIEHNPSLSLKVCGN
jgi:hypothetical protein